VITLDRVTTGIKREQNLFCKLMVARNMYPSRNAIIREALDLLLVNITLVNESSKISYDREKGIMREIIDGI